MGYTTLQSLFVTKKKLSIMGRRTNGLWILFFLMLASLFICDASVEEGDYAAESAGWAMQTPFFEGERDARACTGTTCDSYCCCDTPQFPSCCGATYAYESCFGSCCAVSTILQTICLLYLKKWWYRFILVWCSLFYHFFFFIFISRDFFCYIFILVFLSEFKY